MLVYHNVFACLPTWLACLAWLQGENNGANIVNANPWEIAQRMQCYAKHNAPIGASWAMPHWCGRKPADYLIYATALHWVEGRAVLSV